MVTKYLLLSRKSCIFKLIIMHCFFELRQQYFFSSLSSRMIADLIQLSFKKINQDNKIPFALFFLGSSTKTLEWWSFSQRSNFYAWIAPSKIIPSRSTCSSLWQVIIPISKINYCISSYSFRSKNSVKIEILRQLFELATISKFKKK